MKNNTWVLILIFISTSVFSQTKNENLNTHLGEMKKFFLAEDYESFANYTYPKVIEMMGGKSNMVRATRQSINKIKNDGFSFIDVNFKNPSKFLKKGNELQCSLTQVLIMDTPQGKIESEYTLIGLSKDDGEKWTFIDTSGKDKATMLKYFPNLHSELVIKPKIQRQINAGVQPNVPKGEKEKSFDSFSNSSKDRTNSASDEGVVLNQNETNTDSFAYKIGSLFGQIAAFLTLMLLLGLIIFIIYLFRKKNQNRKNGNISSSKTKKAVTTDQNEKGPSFKSTKANKKTWLEDQERLKIKEAESLKKRKEKEDPRRFMPK